MSDDDFTGECPTCGQHYMRVQVAALTKRAEEAEAERDEAERECDKADAREAILTKRCEALAAALATIDEYANHRRCSQDQKLFAIRQALKRAALESNDGGGRG